MRCNVCDALSEYAVPQRCICGKEGCETCLPNGLCPKCKEWSARVCVCPSCQSTNSKCFDWDDYDEMIIHNDFTCQDCGHGWSAIVPINEDDVVRKLGLKGKTVHTGSRDSDDKKYN